MATIKDLKRMCDTYKDCHECPLNDTCCDGSVSALPDSADEIVDEWASEHPIKTYLQDFSEKFPKAPKGEEGTPKICPHQIYPEISADDRCPEDCLRCWNQEMEEE
nr:MAG TPA: antirestriction protein [Caudoviricetes sp.]